MTSYTKGELLRCAIAFALTPVRFKGRKLELSEADRYQIVAHTVSEPRKNGSTRRLASGEAGYLATSRLEPTPWRGVFTCV